MGRKFYEIVFVTAFMTGLITGISIVFGIDINPINIVLDTENKIINTTGSITQTMTPIPSSLVYIQKMWGELKIVILSVDTLFLIIAVITAIMYRLIGIICFICSLAGGLLLPLGASKADSSALILGAILIVIGGTIAFWVNDNRANDGE